MRVIVCGMHRSGTSALAGVLHANGICMGKEENFIPKPAKENKKGFFEDVEFRRLNDDVLKCNGYVVKQFKLDPPEFLGISSFQFIKGRVLLDERDKVNKNWGWKDPRNCLTLPFWTKVVNYSHSIDTFVVCIIRKQEEVAMSMVARGNKGTISYYKELWQVYYDRFHAAVVPQVVSPVYIYFDDLIRDPKGTMEYLSGEIGYQITDVSSIDTKLRTQKI